MANFIRNDRVDLSKYLPAFLTKAPEFAAKLAAESNAHDEIRQNLDDILNQFFVQTATWGLVYWENYLGITTDTNKTIDMRRQAIIQKINGNDVVTLKFLTRLVNQHVADSQAFIIDHPETYSIEILYHGGQIQDYNALDTAINTYIPAHIGFKLITYTTDTVTYYGAGTAQSYTKTNVDMTNKYTISTKDMIQYTAGVVAHNYKKITIGEQ